MVDATFLWPLRPLAQVLGVESTLEEDLAGLAVAEKLCGRLSNCFGTFLRT